MAVKPLLSIMVCGLIERREKFTTLLDALQQQAARLPAGYVEVLHELDNREITTGGKRNKLLYRASGIYGCYIDDDDMPSDGYTEGICEALLPGPDVVAVHAVVTGPGGQRQDTIISRTRYNHKLRHRTANHITPMKRSLAILAGGFADVTAGEDADFSARAWPLLRTETVADPRRVSYLYRYDPKASATYHAPHGTLYRNTFGGAFIFEADLAVQVARTLSFRIGGVPVNFHVAPGKARCRFMRPEAEGPIMLKISGTIAAQVPSSSDAVLLEILRAERVKFLGITECSLNGRPAKLPYKRPFEE